MIGNIVPNEGEWKYITEIRAGGGDTVAIPEGAKEIYVEFTNKRVDTTYLADCFCDFHPLVMDKPHMYLTNFFYAFSNGALQRYYVTYNVSKTEVSGFSYNAAGVSSNDEWMKVYYR